MRGPLANAILLAGLAVPLCLNAQARNAPHSSFSHAGGFRSYPVASRPRPRQANPAASDATSRKFTLPPVTGTSLINPGEASCLLNPSFSGSYYCRQYFSGRPGWGYEPVYPAWFPSVGYEADDSAPPSSEPPQDSQLAAQVGNLATEVERMREDQAQRDSRQPPSAETPPTVEEEPPATLFVYRDGRQMEVQYYAILGSTLWVISGQMTRQVPLADLDLAATERVNGERGVDFVSPTQR